jgi:hypothetical protein
MPKHNSHNAQQGPSARSSGSSRVNRPGRRSRDRRLSVRSELRAEPDVRKIARAVVALALAQAEKDAQAEKEAQAEKDARSAKDAQIESQASAAAGEADEIKGESAIHQRNGSDGAHGVPS